ncbi:MBOAT family protein [soil metagenome]
MLFNSIEFFLFLPVAFMLYWFVANKHLQAQNALIVILSYIFYGWWDWRFLSLLALSSLIDFSVGIALSNTSTPSKRKLLLAISLATNLGLLGFFKYYNFFVAEFIEAFSHFGLHLDVHTLGIILPVGISFYTFQTMSYTIDVYRRTMEPTKDIIAFFAYVSFFPQLVAGPIERATNLLPQFTAKRHFDYAHATDGMRQILWGFFKKVVIADNCAPYVNDIFGNSADYNGGTLALGAVLFAFQIYGDFSGYSDIAIGTARLFGFNLMQNFAYPYFSRDIAEFWRRWHISLSTWFRDYVYIPLGGSKGGTAMKIRNTFIIFLVSGFWHGANFTFLAWGFLHALYFIPLQLTGKNRVNINVVAHGDQWVSPIDVVRMLLTFVLVTFGWIFFRAKSITHAFEYIMGIFTKSPLESLTILPLSLLALIGFMLAVEWLHRDKKHGLEVSWLLDKKVLRWGMYLGMMLLIFLFGNFGKTEFIYFAF